jgi:hypothetical protein
MPPRRASISLSEAIGDGSADARHLLKYQLTLMSERLEQASNIAKAAQTCADAGSASKGLEIALDIEQLIYEASTTLNAASILNRINRIR